MRVFSVLGLGLAFMAGGCASLGGPDAAPSRDVVRHVVLFKFKDGVSPDQVRAIEEGFAKLPSKIDVIRDFEWGTDMSTENLTQGYTHCFVVTFEDAAGRDAYVPHPAHKEFAKLLGPHLDKVLVIDFHARR